MGDHDRGVDVAALVLTEIRRALGERGGDLTVLSGAERFDDLGVTSLDLAELVATLDAKLGSSPFGQSLALTELRTVSDLQRAYGRPARDERADADTGDLAQSQRRALARRAATSG